MMQIDGVPIEETFAEAFDMKATRLIVTAEDSHWCDAAVVSMCGFGTSVIGCGLEIAKERDLTTDQTPDGRVGAAVLAFAASGSELDKQIPRRASQCVLTCPTTALYAGLIGGKDVYEKRVPIGKQFRYFGDGHQIAKVVQDESGPVRYWRIPVMDGEFVCSDDVGRTSGIGGGNFILLGRSLAMVSKAARAAVEAIAELPDVITPFPGGVARSGSKVGSKYKALFASTNEAYCPTLKHLPGHEMTDDTGAVLEIVIDGMSYEAIASAIGIGIRAACGAVGPDGLAAVTAGNYGGKLGKHHFHLHRVLR